MPQIPNRTSPERNRICVLTSLFFLLCYFAPLLSVNGEPREKLREVLMIHSKDTLNIWSRKISEQMKASLAESRVSLSIEHLDGRAHRHEGHGRAFAEYLRVKYATQGERGARTFVPEIIVPVGKDAIEFLAVYRDELFPGIPVVYSGPIQQRGNPSFDTYFSNATGIVSGVNYLGNIELSYRLNPDRDKVFLLFENSREGELQREFALEQIALLDVPVDVEVLRGADFTTEEMIERIRAVEDRASVVFHTWGIDSSGVVLRGIYGRSVISRELDVPIFGVYLVDKVDDVVGGVVVQPRGQADATAELVKEVLNGTEAGDIPPRTRFEANSILLYSELIRWAIPEKRWPESAEIIGRPRTLWTEYKAYVVLASLILVSQAVAVVCLLFALKIKRKLSEERLQSEVALSKANARLEQKNDELAANLDKERKLTTELETANAAKIEFLSVMSHELRTPLNPIIGYTDILSSETTNKEHLRCLDTIRNASSHLLELIENILDFGKASAPPPSEERKPFFFGEMVSEVVALFRNKAVEKGIEIRLDGRKSGEIEVLGDRHALMQVVINLVSNAVKFTNEGSVSLSWTSEESEEGRTEYELKVADTGIGVSPSFKDKLFTPFTQEDASMCRRHEGIGLGLAISKKVAENLGGDLSVESELGEGSVFKFTIPLETTGRLSEEPKQSSTRAQEMGAPSENSDARLLIVDDQKDNRSLMASVIEREGWSHEQAEDGENAIHKFENGNFDAVLMDVRMPGLSGMQATQAIREMGERGRMVPIVGMSAHDSPRVREECFKVGMSDFLLKPIDVKDTVTLLRKWL